MDGTNASEADQERGLLKEQESSEKHDNPEANIVGDSSDHWRRWGPSAWMSFLALMIVMLLVGAWIVADFSQYNTNPSDMGHSAEPPEHADDDASDQLRIGNDANEKVADTGETAQIVRANDYILDREWDFSAPPQRRVYNWTIRDQEHNPDGIYRLMTLVNNQFPGPLVEANEGDTIVVHVNNQATNATAIHWHGIYQNATPHMDGTIGVTQCPIPPGGSFTYEFTVQGQTGTYWWHSHQAVQSSDGLHGPFIIHSRSERRLQPVRYDTDRILLISDHYHDLSSALLWQYLLPDKENAEPVPQSGLINGRNIRNCDDFADRKCDNTSAYVGLPRLDLKPYQSHRLRLINVGAFAEFQFQIDAHELAVIEVDGTDLEPQSYHRININPAQRYSVVVDASIQGAESFWMRARMVTECFTDPPATLEPDVRGVMRYVKHVARHEADQDDDDDDREDDDGDDGDDGDDDKDDDDDNGNDDDDDDQHENLTEETLPTSVDWEEQLEHGCRDMNTTELRPLRPIEAPAEVDAFFYLRSNFEIGAYRLSRGKFNSTIWRPDIRSPSLYRTVDGLKSDNNSFKALESGNNAFVNNVAFDDSRELVIQTTGIQVIDIVISNFDDGNHPIHLHGYKYFVLAQGHGYPPLTQVGADITKENLAPLYESLDLSNPLRRDTASVEAFGWILIRIVADNPGAWALHCHVSWHTEAGLLMQLITRADGLSNLDIPNSGHDLCAAEGIERGSGPRDEDLYQFAR